MIPQRTMQPSIAHARQRTTGPAVCSKQPYHRHNQPHYIGLHPVARKLLLISHPTDSRKLSWPEST